MNHLILFLLPLLAGAASAHPAHECGFALRTPPPIKHTPRGTYKIESRRAAGEIYGPGDLVPRNMASGTYLFLASEDDELIIAPKYDVERYLATGQGLITHKQLLKLYRKRRAGPLNKKVVAAGEFVLAFGEITFIQNRSGNFKAGLRNFDYGIALMREVGFDFAPDFVKDVLTKDSPVRKWGHSSESETFDARHLRLLAEVARHPHGPKLVELYERLGRLLVQIYGKDAGAGGAKIMYQLGRKYNRRAVLMFYYPLTTAASLDGLHLGITNAWHDLAKVELGDPVNGQVPNPEAAAGAYFANIAPYNIQTILMDTAVRTPKQDFELRELASEFMGLTYLRRD